LKAAKTIKLLIYALMALVKNLSTTAKKNFITVKFQIMKNAKMGFADKIVHKSELPAVHLKAP